MTPFSRATNHTLAPRTTPFGRRLVGTRVLRAKKSGCCFFTRITGVSPSEPRLQLPCLRHCMAGAVFLRLRGAREPACMRMEGGGGGHAIGDALYVCEIRAISVHAYRFMRCVRAFVYVRECVILILIISTVPHTERRIMYVHCSRTIIIR